MSLIIKDDLVVIARQQGKNRIEEIFRDPHGNVVKFFVYIIGDTPNAYNEARAYIFTEGRWEPLYRILFEIIPSTPEAAMMTLQTAVAGILDWPVPEGESQAA